MSPRNLAIVLIIFVVLGVVCYGSAQDVGTIPSDKAAAMGKVADQFIDRLHQSLDIFAMNDLLVPNIGTLYRDYPGEFLPFSTPRITKALLKATDGATLNRKLLDDWNLVYLTSLLMNSGVKSDPLKAFPPDFMKVAKKSDYLKPFIKQGSPVTMSTPAELNRYLGEAEQVIPALRQNVKPGMFALHDASVQQYLPTLAPPGSMGYDTVYLVRRESLVLALIEEADGGFKIISLAAPEN
jgi:hypothetical protein